MRKVLLVLMSLILSAALISCSEDETTVTPTPTPTPEDMEITTDSAMTTYTCEPVNWEMDVIHGTAPYTWALADGSDPLPTGFSITSEGTILGVMESTGEWTFTLECTDSADPPQTASREFTLTVSERPNPSMGVFFDESATDCKATTTAWNSLDCYVYILLADEEPNACTYGCTFKLSLKDADGNELEAGTDYAVVSAEYNENAMTMGNLFSGVSVAFYTPYVYTEGPVHVATFPLILLEDMDYINFEFEENPMDEDLAIAQCGDGHPLYEVEGRKAAVNY
jgi:hypothetical protein